jgi:O-antigen/teichoic acid export membrane protein
MTLSPNKRNVLVNVLSYAVLQVVNILVAVFLPRLYLQVYGSEINGLIATINNFISYFSYIEAGIGLALMFALYKPLAEKNVDMINKVVSYSRKTYLKISAFYFLLIVIFSSFYPFVAPSSELSTIDFAALILIIGLYGASDFLTMSKYRVLLTADKKEYVISLSAIASQAIRFVSVFCVLRFAYGISVLMVKLIPVATIFLRSLILAIYVRKHYPDISFKEKASKAEVHVSTHWDALLFQISINLCTTFPVILVSQLFGYAQANVFSTYYLIVSGVISVVSALSSGVTPIFGQLSSQGGDISGQYRKFELFVALVITSIFVTSAPLVEPFVLFYSSVVKDVSYANEWYGVLLSLWGLLFVYRIPLTAGINAYGIYKETRLTNVVNIVLLVGLSLLLGFCLGISGIIIAMIISSLHRDVFYCISLSKAVSKKIVLSSITHILISSALLFCVWAVWVYGFQIQISSIFDWIIAGLCLLPISLVVTLLAFLPGNVSLYRLAIKNLFRKKKGRV